jgi:chemotaxis protein MotA
VGWKNGPENVRGGKDVGYRMDITTILGIVLGGGLILSAVQLSGGLALYFDAPSLLIVIGGTSAAMLMNFPLKQVVAVMTVLPKLVKAQEDDLLHLIQQFIQLAALIRKEGYLALENAAQQVTNPYMKRGLLLVADVVDTEALHGILRLQNLAVEQRHKVGQEILKALGRWAPAFGMIGTLLGLVSMLANLNDPKRLGPGMAVALLTTLYGALIANLFALPMAAKLKQHTDQELLLNLVITEGLKGLQMGLQPRLLEEKLKAFLMTAQQHLQLGDIKKSSTGDEPWLTKTPDWSLANPKKVLPNGL